MIGRTTKITRAGREWKACCPFHNEKTPSFTINDEKGFYHCYGCGAHGDVIRWMTDQRGLTFMDAVKELASMYGSPVSDGGRGLKQQAIFTACSLYGFARQRWRAWIETGAPCWFVMMGLCSPVSDGGRGLKPVIACAMDAGWKVRPSAMAGVD